MNKVKSISKQTQNRFLNLYEYQAVDRKNNEIRYFMASRAKEEENTL